MNTTNINTMFKDVQILEKYLERLPLAVSHWNIPFLALIYLFIVIKLGPMIMKNRAPILWIKNVIPIYNAFQIIANLGIVLWALTDMEFINVTLKNTCGNNPTTDLRIHKKFILLGYFWCLLKISDFLDTFFFIMMKKFSHVSFLHVYHHSTTMMVAFIVYRYLRVEQAAIYAAVNCFVHVVMYQYYMLTSLGYKPKWKKMVTILQLFQFVFLNCMTLSLLTCQKSPKYLYFSVYSTFQCVMYLYLFGSFYVKSYKKLQ